MTPGTALAPVDDIAAKIHTVRGVRVMLDFDLAALYGATTKQLNQVVRRNAGRFPGDFAFHLTVEELAALRSQIVTSNVGRGGRRYLPRAFTEHGAVMAATVLNSPRAVQMSIFVVRGRSCGCESRLWAKRSWRPSSRSWSGGSAPMTTS